MSAKRGKYLTGLCDAWLMRRLREALDGLAVDPRPPGCVKLQGESELYRVRVGDHRIVYQIQDAALVVLVVRIGNRREIYR